ncbi:PREDICTED: cathelin-like [Chinchilla lanigera]|uniref:cathelin-like n=1 Tax=Chinchilla lanigera TaxID=34839 RepID=UPI00069707C6|nr:PREDICTED: cathelin-like [Chinchilla lanigera]
MWPRRAPRAPPLLPLLLLGTLLPPAFAQVLSYQEAVRRAVDGLNQRSADANLFRLLSLDSRPPGDEAPESPKPVSFTVKETVCPKGTQLRLEQCDFKEDGLVKRCSGTVTLDPASSASDVSCTGGQRFSSVAWLRRLLQKGGQKLGEKFEQFGQRIKDFFQSRKPGSEQEK